MQGRRIYCNGAGRFFLDREHQQQIEEAQTGDYWYGALGWACKLPNGLRCGLSKNHQIVEHADDTITASPSILMECNGAPEWNWHGFLERGVWRSC